MRILALILLIALATPCQAQLFGRRPPPRQQPSQCQPGDPNCPDCPQGGGQSSSPGTPATVRGADAIVRITQGGKP